MSARRFGGIGQGGRIGWLVFDAVMIGIVFGPILIGPFVPDFSWGLSIFWVLCLSFALYLYWQMVLAVETVIDEPQRQVRLITYKSFLRRRTETIPFNEIERIGWTVPAPVQQSDEVAELPVPQLHMRNGQVRPLTAHLTTSASSALDASRMAQSEGLAEALSDALKRVGSDATHPSQLNPRGSRHA